MARPFREYLRAAEDAWLAKSPAMFRTSLNLQDYLRDHARKSETENAIPPDKERASLSADYRQAGLAMSSQQTGLSSEQRREAAEQQWQTIQGQGANDGVHLLRQPINYQAVIQGLMNEAKAAEQQWRTISRAPEKMWIPSAELDAVMKLSREPQALATNTNSRSPSPETSRAFLHVIDVGRQVNLANPRHHDRDRGQERR